MSMIPINAEVSINRTTVDAWGVSVANGITETIKCYVSYKLGLKGTEVNTNSSSLEAVPSGSMFLNGLVKVTYQDDLSWAGFDGNILTIKPNAIDYIIDSAGKVIFTKVTF